jgi:F420H(2)-dependent quinone reductase
VSALRRLGWKAWNGFTSCHTAVYRLTNGRIGRRFRGAPVLLVDHVGRRSGKRRTSPLMYLRDGDNFVIVASKGGSHKHPAWFLNLQDRPQTTIQFDAERCTVRAREASADERERLWPQLVEIYSNYADYQQRTSRLIPVVILERD